MKPKHLIFTVLIGLFIVGYSVHAYLEKPVFPDSYSDKYLSVQFISLDGMWKSGGGMDTRDGVRLRNFAGGGTGGSHDIEVEIVEVRETDFDVTLKGWYQWNGMGKTSHIDNILTILVEEGKGRLALGPNHEVLLRLEDY